MIAGDFGAHSPKWGSSKEDVKGELLSTIREQRAPLDNKPTINWTVPLLNLIPEKT